jgi:hypothetical protein
VRRRASTRLFQEHSTGAAMSTERPDRVTRLAVERTISTEKRPVVYASPVVIDSRLVDATKSIISIVYGDIDDVQVRVDSRLHRCTSVVLA